MNLRSLIAAAGALVLVSCVQHPAFARQVKPIECVLGNMAGQLVIPKPCLRVIDAAREHNRKLKVRKAPNGFDISASRRRAHARPFRSSRVCEGNACGTVVAHAAEKFRGLFRDLIALGYNLGSPGCYSPTGHMRNSLHHWGGACDLFNQVGRNITALRQPPPSVQVELAARHGLTSGCAWRSPDCGHFDLSGIGMAGGATRRYVAKRYYYARQGRGHRG